MRAAYYNEIEPFGCAWLREAIAKGLLPAGDVDERDIRLVQPDDLRGYGQVHLFAGIGGGGLACRLAGVPDDFLIVTAGVPCQPSSLAGNRLGESDERWLWPEFLRLLGDRVLRLHYALAENPPGILTLADGGAWAGILAALASIGRDAEWSSVSAADVGATHERERVWLVAYPAFARLAIGGSERGDCGEEQPPSAGDRAARGAGPLADSCGTRCDASHEEDGGPGRLQRESAGSGESVCVAHPDDDAPRRLHEGWKDEDRASITSGIGEAGGMADPSSQSAGEPHAEAHAVSGSGEARPLSVGGGVRRGSGERRSPWPPEPAMGGATHGLPAYLGGAQWPAPPGAPQWSWEAPRLVAELGPDDRKALAAFGNAWVPQSAVPALRVILEHARVPA